MGQSNEFHAEKELESVTQSPVVSRLFETPKESLEHTGEGTSAGKLSEREQTRLDQSLFLPQLDLSGFGQEAPYHSRGGLKDVWHDIKHVFAKDETLDEKLRHHVESKMSEPEHKVFESENKAMEDYRRNVIAWSLSTVLPPPPYPKRPDTPMHEEICRRAEMLEQNITREVRNSMSPTDLIRLDKQMSDYKQRVKESRSIRSPYGTGEAFKMQPKPGFTIQDYFQRVAEATEKYLQNH